MLHRVFGALRVVRRSCDPQLPQVSRGEPEHLPDEAALRSVGTAQAVPRASGDIYTPWVPDSDDPVVGELEDVCGVSAGTATVRIDRV